MLFMQISVFFFCQFFLLIVDFRFLIMIKSIPFKMLYTIEHRVWLIKVYYKTENARKTAKLFKRHFKLPAPSHHTVLSLIQKFEETGSVANKLKIRDPSVLTPKKVDDIEAHFSKNPTTSIRKAACVFDISKNSVHRVLYKIGMHPYKSIKVQKLMPSDYPLRLKFAYEFAYACKETEKQGGNLHDMIIWTDECIVQLNSSENSQNYRHWDFQNPYNLVELPNYPQKVHIWAGICSYGVIGPYFFHNSVTASSYVEMLNNWFWPLIINMPEREAMWFMQDGATPHYSTQAREWLNNKFPGKWIGRGGPWSWPPRSPDLTPADFFCGDI
jgi:transposase